MNIIEEAARRLEQLSRAGVTPPPRRSAGSVNTRSNVVEIANGDAVHVDLDAESAVTGMRIESQRVEIALSTLTAKGFIAPDAPRSRLADEFRVIKRPLLDNVHGRSAAPVARANCIMITSAVPGEGKTFTSINLALSIAQELETHVMLVDADVVRPSLLERLGLPSSPGLMDVLSDPNVNVADVILRTNIDRLSLLPAGTPQARATELVASVAMRNLVEQMSKRYPDRVMIFDAPPLLLSTESHVLAALMGQVVVVVEAERTPTVTVSRALETLANCPVVMTLLNKARSRSNPTYAGYHAYAP